MNIISNFLLQAGIWDTLKNLFVWIFDPSCDPDKFMQIFLNIFM